MRTKGRYWEIFWADETSAGEAKNRLHRHNLGQSGSGPWKYLFRGRSYNFSAMWSVAPHPREKHLMLVNKPLSTCFPEAPQPHNFNRNACALDPTVSQFHPTRAGLQVYGGGGGVGA